MLQHVDTKRSKFLVQRIVHTTHARNQLMKKMNAKVIRRVVKTMTKAAYQAASVLSTTDELRTERAYQLELVHHSTALERTNTMIHAHHTVPTIAVH